MSTLKFKVSGTSVIDNDATASFTTDALEFRNSHDWSVQFSKTGVDGAPVYTIEVTNDALNSTSWDNYDPNAISLSTDDSFGNHFMEFRFMRIVYVSTGVTTGMHTLLLNINNDNTN